jgi:hypothetical protein
VICTRGAIRAPGTTIAAAPPSTPSQSQIPVATYVRSTGLSVIFCTCFAISSRASRGSPSHNELKFWSRARTKRRVLRICNLTVTESDVLRRSRAATSCLSSLAISVVIDGEYPSLSPRSWFAMLRSNAEICRRRSASPWLRAASAFASSSSKRLLACNRQRPGARRSPAGLRGARVQGPCGELAGCSCTRYRHAARASSTHSANLRACDTALKRS